MRISQSATTLLLIALLGLTTPGIAGAVESEKELASEAEALLANIEQMQQEVDELKLQMADAHGEARLLLERRIRQRALRFVSDVDALADNVMDREAQGFDASLHRQRVESLMAEMTPLIWKRIDDLRESLAAEGAGSDSMSPSELFALEERIDRGLEKLDLLFEILVDHVERMERLGLDVSEEKPRLVDGLTNRADTIAARIDLAQERAEEARVELANSPGDSSFQTALRLAEKKMEASTADLKISIELLNRLNVDTAGFQQVLIKTTGEVTADILDSGVALGLIGQWIASGRAWIVANGPKWFFKVLMFCAVLLIFRLLAGIAGKVVRRAVSTSKFQLSRLLQDMITSMTSRVVMLLGLLVALFAQIGISLAPVLAGLGVAGFIVGFALQDSLANFAAGAMILLYRPYDVGDLIEAGGVFGSVSRMSLVSTTILTIDNQTLVVPNNKIWGDVIKNVTAQELRRVDMVFGISYSDDIPATEEILKSILEAHDKILDTPEPIVKLHALGESSVDFVVRPWVKTGDYWDVYWDVTREVKMRFDREGVSIPFPQRDVHVFREEAATA